MADTTTEEVVAMTRIALMIAVAAVAIALVGILVHPAPAFP
jgi:hypothetical protein